MTAAPIQLFPDDQPPPEEAPNDTEILPPPSDPLAVVRILQDEWTDGDGHLLLRKWRGDFYGYAMPHYAVRDPESLRKLLYERTERAWYSKPTKDDPGKIAPWAPDTNKIDKLLNAMVVPALIEPDLEAPVWLPTGEQRPELVATPDGLLNIYNRTVVPATPAWFTTWALPFSYDAAAPEPTAWLAFLNSAWPHDPATVQMVQEWLGLLVTGKTDLHKAMLLVGPRRSGKGTLLRTATALMGKVNTASPTLSSLTEQFGLAPCIGKSLLAVGDARLSGPTSTLVERILSITGEDSITVARKYKESWTGRLPGRLMIASNEVPDFRDPSGAIGSRFLVAKMVTSFYGREDVNLESKLRVELPAIMRWALDGWDRLYKNGGRFTEGPAAAAARLEMEESESPLAQFVEAACVVGPYVVPRDVLFTAWDIWRRAHGYAESNISTFGRQLRAAHPQIEDARPRSDGLRVRCYSGIGIRESFTGTEEYGTGAGKMGAAAPAILKSALAWRIGGC